MRLSYYIREDHGYNMKFIRFPSTYHLYICLNSIYFFRIGDFHVLTGLRKAEILLWKMYSLKLGIMSDIICRRFRIILHRQIRFRTSSIHSWVPRDELRAESILRRSVLDVIIYKIFCIEKYFKYKKKCWHKNHTSIYFLNIISFN